MTVYYNENDPRMAAWLRELIAAGEIPAGDVDERSIEDVAATDLVGYEQCHFFAGIGGWPLALRLAGWPDDRPAWTGSCPCQPFSAAGRHGGVDDPRHLWPAWRWLIDQCRPPVIVGEQVASKAGREWLAGVLTDLEAMAYAAAGADLCAAGVGAPHIRQRLWWVADARGERFHWQPVRLQPERQNETGPEAAGRSAWGGVIWTSCADGKARRIKPGLEPLAHGVSGRVGLLRGYGNAIVPQVAAEFVSAYMEAA